MERWRFEITDLGEADLEKLDVPTRTCILQKLRWLVDNEESKKLVSVHTVDLRDRVYKKVRSRLS